MTYSYEITKAEKATVLADKSEFIDVWYNIKDSTGKVVASYREGFATNTKEATIRTYLQAKVDGYVADELNKEADAQKAKAAGMVDTTIKGLLGGDKK